MNLFKLILLDSPCADTRSIDDMKRVSPEAAQTHTADDMSAAVIIIFTFPIHAVWNRRVLDTRVNPESLFSE